MSLYCINRGFICFSCSAKCFSYYSIQYSSLSFKIAVSVLSLCMDVVERANLSPKNTISTFSEVGFTQPPWRRREPAHSGAHAPCGGRLHDGGMGDEVSASWLTMRRLRFPIVRSEGLNAKRAAKTGKPERAKTACEGLLLQPARHHFPAQHNRRHHNGQPQTIAQPSAHCGFA